MYNCESRGIENAVNHKFIIVLSERKLCDFQTQYFFVLIISSHLFKHNVFQRFCTFWAIIRHLKVLVIQQATAEIITCHSDCEIKRHWQCGQHYFSKNAK